MSAVALALGITMVAAACSGEPQDDAAAAPGGPATSEPDASGAPAGEVCDPINFATIDDDAHRVGWYALSNGLIESDILTDFNVSYLALPALAQAAGTGEYQMMQASLAVVPFARANAGLDFRFLGFGSGYGGSGPAFYVQADSDITSPEQFAGQTLGVQGFTSVFAREAQLVLAETYGLAFPIEGGDITWVELDPPTLLNAVKEGDIDGAVLAYQAAWLAQQDPALKNVGQLDAMYQEATDGSIPFGSAIIAENEYIEANSECVAEFQRMAAESNKYAEEHYTEFADEIVETTGVAPEYLEYYWATDENYMFYGGLEQEWVDSAQKFYDVMTEHGLYPEALKVEELIVE
ncbi:ABC transporter substrate-binding protein [Georgenia yuyongxinii]|nr:MqnA/MqnD/SBP family protein [Georgenia yuyongxinii]